MKPIYSQILTYLLIAFVALTPSFAVAQDDKIIFNAGAIIPNGIAIGDIGPIFVNDTTSYINITVATALCDSNGDNCGQAYPGVDAKVQLNCANVNSGSVDYSSDLLGSVQHILISPKSSAYLVGDNQTTPEFSCSVVPEDYLPGSMAWNFTATAISNYTVTLSQAEQENAKEIFDACCSQGVCDAWDQATEAAGLDFAAGQTFTDLCNIEGNMCSPEGNLITWNMVGYGLKCNVSSITFANFTALQHLILSGNNLTGNANDLFDNLIEHQIPITDLRVNSNFELAGSLDAVNATAEHPAICGLVKLQQLLFGGTSITGTIPECLFSANSTLQQLYGSSSQVNGQLPPMANSTTLQVLQIRGTNLTGTMPTVPSSLLKLNLSTNAITGSLIDPEETPDLVSLDVSENSLDGELPAGLADHKNLFIIDLRNNNFSGLPTAWRDEKKALSDQPPLQYLFLSGNPLFSVFPSGLMHYPNLTLLDLDETELQGGLPEIHEGGFPSLYALYAANNSLDGAIPESWNNTNLFSLANSNSTIQNDATRFFVLSNNTLTGILPSWMAGPFPSYIDIELKGNTFDNACDPQFALLELCDGSPSPAVVVPTETSPSPSEESPSPPSPPPPPAEETSSGLSAGAKAGIVIAVLLLLGALGYLGYILWKNRRDSSQGRFQRFDEDGNVEMARSNTGYYNSQLQP